MGVFPAIPILPFVKIAPLFCASVLTQFIGLGLTVCDSRRRDLSPADTDGRQHFLQNRPLISHLG